VKLISPDPHVNLCTMITEDPDLGDWGATMLHTEDLPRLCSRMHALLEACPLCIPMARMRLRPCDTA
jgi:hypothetical protein